jgi:ATP-binding cassette subfamily B protein RaxB
MSFFNPRKLSFIPQTEIAECGIACLAMVVAYYGASVKLAELRERYPQSLGGVTLARIIQIASELGLQSRPVQLELNALPRLRTPAILHWNLSHFVVLGSATRQHIVIYDPSAGRLRMTRAEASRHFTGIALELAPNSLFESVRRAQRVSFKSLTGGIVGLKSSLLRVLTLALALEAITLIPPLASQVIIDQVVPTNDRQLLVMVVVSMSALLLLQSCIRAMRSWSLIVLGSNTAFSWSRNVFTHLMKLPARYFSNRSLGDIVSRFDSIHEIQHILTDRSLEAALDGVTACVTAVVIVLYSPFLSVIPFTACALYGLYRISSYNRLQLASQENISCSAALQTFLVESIRGVQTIKLQNGVDFRASQFANSAFKTTQTRIAVDRLNIVFSTCSSLIMGLERLFVLCLGGEMILDHQMTVGALMVFLLYSGQMSERCTKFFDYLILFRMLRLQTARLSDIVLSAPEPYTTSSIRSSSIVPSIEFRNVTFRYDPFATYIIKDCSFTVLPGESVAVIGPSGCGKTTLAKLLLGLLDPESGQILIGGVDLREIGKNSLRAMTSSVLQEDQIFSGSIEDNIHFFDPDADIARVHAAASTAQIHLDVLSFPMGYRTLVGDLGSTLSAGQKQRLLLARALYRNPKILVLDEATCHLDARNDRVVWQALRCINVTRIIVTHRPETIRMADRVLVLAQDSDIEIQSVPLRTDDRELAV